MSVYSDTEQIILQAWQDMITEEEDACYAILEREYLERKEEAPVVLGVIDMSREVA